jgi:hypothetical protein
MSQLHEASTSQVLALYLLDDGDACAHLLAGLLTLLKTVQLASKRSGRHTKQDLATVRRGIEMCAALTACNRYQKGYARDIEHALVTALYMAKKIPPEAITKAWKGLQ